MPIERKPEEYKNVLKEKAILEFVRENHPIRAEIIFEIFPKTDLVDLERDNKLKYIDGSQIVQKAEGWVYDFSLTRSDYWERRKYDKEFDPSTVECLIREGNILLKYRKFPMAILRFEEVIKRDKKNTDALYGLCIAEFQSAKKSNLDYEFRKAVRSLNKILSINPRHHIALNEKKSITLYQEFLEKEKELKKNIALYHKYGIKHPRRYRLKIRKLRSEIAQIRKKLTKWRNDRLKNPNRVEGAKIAWITSDILQKRKKENKKIKLRNEYSGYQERKIKAELAKLREQLEHIKKRKKR